MTSIIKSNQIMEEVTDVTFSSGGAIVSGKSGYSLVNVYAVNRPTSETSNYAVTSIYGRTDGSYRLQNVSSGLSSVLTVRLIWLRN